MINFMINLPVLWSLKFKSIQLLTYPRYMAGSVGVRLKSDLTLLNFDPTRMHARTRSVGSTKDR